MIDGKTKAAYIKEHVSMPDVIARYHRAGRHRGRTSCPFHGGEKDNLSYNDKVFHCFVCGVGGDVISFTQRIHSLSFADALGMLDRDFDLGLSSADCAAAEAAQRQRESEERRKRAESARARKIFVMFTRVVRWIHRRPEQTSIHDAQAAFLDRQCDYILGGGVYTSDPKATARAAVQRVRAAEKEAAHAG